MYVGFRVPAGGPERLWVGLWGGDGALYFNVDVTYLVTTVTDPEQWSKAVETLRGHGFENVRDSDLSRDLELTPELLAEDELQQKVLDFAKESFALLKQSGVFELAAPAAVPIDDEATGVD